MNNLAIINQTAEETGNKVVKFPAQRANFLVHQSNNKVIAVLWDETTNEINFKNVEGQHTMNCLLMQKLDTSLPFNSFDIKGQYTSKVKQDFEDSLLAVYRLHSKLSQAGYRLWNCKVVQFADTVSVINTYFSPTDLKYRDEDRNYDNCTRLEATVVLPEFEGIVTVTHGTITHPKLNRSTGVIREVMVYDTVAELHPIMHITHEASKRIRKMQPLELSPSYHICKAWDVANTYSDTTSSTPGRVDTIREFLCDDSYGNLFTLKIRTNI